MQRASHEVAEFWPKKKSWELHEGGQKNPKFPPDDRRALAEFPAPLEVLAWVLRV